MEGIVTVLRHTFGAEDGVCGESHDFPELLYIGKGRHVARVGGEEISLSAGQMLIYPPNVCHSAGSLTGAQGWIVSFKTDNEILLPVYGRVFTLSSAQRQTLMQIMEAGLVCFVPCGEDDRANGRQGMVLSPDAEAATLRLLKKQLEFFLADILKTATVKEGSGERKTRDFEAVCAYLEANISKTLSVSEIARGSGMSVSKLKPVVREKSGGGVTELFNGMKIEKAKALIEKGELSFTEISQSLGFGSLHYFSRAFKKHTGLSPSEYKRQK